MKNRLAEVRIFQHWGSMGQAVARESHGKKVGTEAARMAFIHGDGNGRRVVDVKELAEIGGITVQTVRNNLPAWEAEFREIISSSSAAGISLVLDAATIETHRNNLESWRKLDAELLQEINELPKITKFLQSCVQWTKDNGDKGDVAEMHERVSSFLRTIGARKSLINQRLAVNARWNGLSGVDALLDAAGAKVKAIETGRAKMEIELERKEKGLSPGAPNGGVLNLKPGGGRIYVKKGEGGTAQS